MVAPDSNVALVQQHLLVSLEAVRTAATEANQVLLRNPGVDGSSLATAIHQLLEAQSELFVAVEELVDRTEEKPAEKPAPPGDVLVVTPEVVTKRTKREYDYFADLRKVLADGEPARTKGAPNATSNGSTPEGDANPGRESNGVVPEVVPAAAKVRSSPMRAADGSSPDPDASIGELPQDWGDPQDWIEAPLRRLFKGRTKKGVRPSPQQT